MPDPISSSTVHNIPANSVETPPAVLINPDEVQQQAASALSALQLPNTSTSRLDHVARQIVETFRRTESFQMTMTAVMRDPRNRGIVARCRPCEFQVALERVGIDSLDAATLVHRAQEQLEMRVRAGIAQKAHAAIEQRIVGLEAQRTPHNAEQIDAKIERLRSYHDRVDGFAWQVGDFLTTAREVLREKNWAYVGGNAERALLKRSVAAPDTVSTVREVAEFGHLLEGLAEFVRHGGGDAAMSAELALSGAGTLGAYVVEHICEEKHEEFVETVRSLLENE